MPKQNFENAMKRLEDIVRELESGEVSLEDSLKRFEEGIKLSRLCSKKLDAIDKKVSILLQDEEKEVDEETLES